MTGKLVNPPIKCLPLHQPYQCPTPIKFCYQIHKPLYPSHKFPPLVPLPNLAYPHYEGTVPYEICQTSNPVGHGSSKIL